MKPLKLLGTSLALTGFVLMVFGSFEFILIGLSLVSFGVAAGWWREEA